MILHLNFYEDPQAVWDIVAITYTVNPFEAVTMDFIAGLSVSD